MGELRIGLHGKAALRVAPNHTAEALGSGDVPVLATPAIVALLERAAVNAVQETLAPGEITVGTWLEVSHLAPTPVGADVTADAELTAIEGRKLTFTIVAHDNRNKIGECKHHRMIVSRERFLAKAAGNQ